MAHHGAGLRRILEHEGVAGADRDALIAGLCGGAALDTLPLDRRARELLRYADRLTLRPASIRQDDIDRLRDAGLDDRAIHDACALVAYYAFVNRVADGLGVELEEED